MTSSNEYDKYLSVQPEDTQKALAELRRCIKLAAPKATELINYGIPAFALVEGGKRDTQIMIAGFKKHVGFYPGPSVIEKFAHELSEYKTSKGAIQFPLSEPIPKALVTKMVRFRMKEIASS